LSDDFEKKIKFYFLIKNLFKICQIVFAFFLTNFWFSGFCICFNISDDVFQILLEIFQVIFFHFSVLARPTAHNAAHQITNHNKSFSAVDFFFMLFLILSFC